MKLTRHSIGVKLWLYFILFASVLLTMLWFLQIVFMQSFYESMKTSAIAGIADQILSQYGRDDFESAVDRITFHNSVLVFVTDAEGNVIYASDEHGGGPGGERKPGPTPNDWPLIRPLPYGFDEFLERMRQSESGRIHYSVENTRFQGNSLVYGARMQDALLYISTPLDPVNATTDILSTQLVYVTVSALFLSLIIAFFIARRLAKPISAISHRAAKLAKGEFETGFDKGFCSEIDELASTLDHAALELSKVEKLRRELIANISHELRTPLTMVKAYAEMIRDISGDNKEKREAHLAVIEAEANRLTLLVNDLLDLSVIQSGNETVQMNNVHLSDLVNNVLSRFEPIFEHEGYTLLKTIEPDQYVQGDAQRLTQVLYNLMANAMNYIGEDKRVSVRLADLGSRARVEITDYGDGIPEDELASVWERYYQSKGQKRPRTGTGLGLSIVKGILELHGARFGAVSSVGKGSTFWFEMHK